MYFGIFTLLTALTISVIAAWYSIVGLTAIFAAAFVPIIIMGGSLELGKVVTAVWLHQNWDRANKLMRTYLITATFLLMFITSMGIFGFLSKAHVEQTAASDESIALIEQYGKEIDRQNEIVDRTRNRISELENSSTSADANFQEQIDKEQGRIDSAYNRIQPAIDEQNSLISAQTKLHQDQLDVINKELQTLQDYIDAGEIKKAQQLIGEKSKGGWGPKTSETARLWRLERTEKRDRVFAKIEEISQSDPTIVAARKEIARLRQSAENQIAQSNELINRLRGQIGTNETANLDVQIDALNDKISTAIVIIDQSTSKKYELEGEYRKLEAEVGPVKYIAEFVYGETADKDMLERAVRWVIIILVLVFDPLAICLILAGAQQVMWAREEGGHENHLLDFSGGLKKPDPRQPVDLGEAPTDDVQWTDPEPESEVQAPEEFVLEKEPEFTFPDHAIIPTKDAHFDGEPEPTVTEVEEQTSSIVDSIDEMLVDPEPPTAEVAVKNRKDRKNELHRLDEERQALVKEIQQSESQSNNTLPPKSVATIEPVLPPKGTKPFVKDHK